MTVKFRDARRDEVPQIVALLTDDALGSTREGDTLAPYFAAFDRMQSEGGNQLIVGELDGRIAASYQLSFLSGLSLKAARRAQVESVRVASDLRGQGLGALMMADAEARARAAGCCLMQLTTNAQRSRARAFYERLGFTPSHIGFKRDLT